MKKTSDKKQAIKTKAHEKDIVEYLKRVGEANVASIAEEIGLSHVRTRAVLAKMSEVEAVGGNRNRTYRIKT